jgi:hypothetical protein
MSHVLIIRNDARKVVYSKVGGFAELKAIVNENVEGKGNEFEGSRASIMSLSNPQKRYILDRKPKVKKSTKKAK